MVLCSVLVALPHAHSPPAYVCVPSCPCMHARTDFHVHSIDAVPSAIFEQQLNTGREKRVCVCMCVCVRRLCCRLFLIQQTHLFVYLKPCLPPSLVLVVVPLPCIGYRMVGRSDRWMGCPACALADGHVFDSLLLCALWCRYWSCDVGFVALMIGLCCCRLVYFNSITSCFGTFDPLDR